ncbi:MAG: NAD(P)H-dependent oxidoreductase [Actinomycetota bacterium]
MKVLVVHAHPSAESFNAALCDRVLSGLARGSHEVRLRRLHDEGFEPRLSAAEWLVHLDPPATKPQLASHFDDLRWCDTLVLVYPTWWGAQPAMLKGWLDRVWVKGVAWDLPEGASRLRPLLRNVRRLVAVTTHGSSWRVNAVQGAPGRRIVARGMRVICHPFCRTKWIAMYSLDSSTDARRAAFLRRVENYFARL